MELAEIIVEERRLDKACFFVQSHRERVKARQQWIACLAKHSQVIVAAAKRADKAEAALADMVDSDIALRIKMSEKLTALTKTQEKAKAELADKVLMFWALDEHWIYGGSLTIPGKPPEEKWTWLRWGEHVPLPVDGAGQPRMTTLLRNDILKAQEKEPPADA